MFPGGGRCGVVRERFLWSVTPASDQASSCLWVLWLGVRAGPLRRGWEGRYCYLKDEICRLQWAMAGRSGVNPRTILGIISVGRPSALSPKLRWVNSRLLCDFQMAQTWLGPQSANQRRVPRRVGE